MSPDYIYQATTNLPGEMAPMGNRREILASAERLGITKVVHFTTLRGCLGALATGAVKSRKRLRKDQYLELVYRPNAAFRKDTAWIDYVSLSIERINDWMFDTSKRWHADENNPWVLLSFHPRILSHTGVVFATTNNIYPTCRRAEGLAGFEQMFANQVAGRFGRVHDRSSKQPSWPTDRQAEVLYPKELSCNHLQRIYVQCDDTLEQIHGILGALQLSVDVQYTPKVFE